MLLGACSQGLESDSKHGFAKTSNLFKMMVIIVIIVVVVVLVFVGVFCVHIVCCWCHRGQKKVLIVSLEQEL